MDIRSLTLGELEMMEDIIISKMKTNAKLKEQREAADAYGKSVIDAALDINTQNIADVHAQLTAATGVYKSLELLGQNAN